MSTRSVRGHPGRSRAPLLLLLAGALALPSAVGAADWLPLAPSASPGGPIVYDAPRDRLVLIGGHDATDVWCLQLPGDSSWRRLAPPGPGPGARSGHSAIYDPLRDRIVVYGGSDAAGDSVWALELAGTPRWTAIAGCRPEARAGHSAVYDSRRDRMVVFGGLLASGLSSRETWFLSLSGTPRWTGLSPLDASPSNRLGHAAAYDPVHDRMVVFGGSSDGLPVDNGTYALTFGDTAAWARLGTAHAPPGLVRASAIADGVTGRVVLFGGTRCAWALRDSAGIPDWVTLDCTGPAGAGAAAFDARRERLILYGGVSGNEAWALSLGDPPGWSLLTPAAWPPERRLHVELYDPVRERMVVSGGWTQNHQLMADDVWALQLAEPRRWSRLVAPGDGPALAEHAAIFDPDSERMVVFGGYRGSWAAGPTNEVWSLALGGDPAWRRIEVAGDAPAPRTGPSAIYDPLRRRMIVFGGAVPGPYGVAFLDDVWALGLGSEPSWTRLQPAGTPPIARAHHAAVYDAVRDRMIVFGGEGEPCPEGWICMAGYYGNDVWALDLAGDPAWHPLKPDLEIAGVPPTGRQDFGAFYDPVRRRMVVGGGAIGAGSPDFPLDLADMWALSLEDSATWSALPARTRGSDGVRMILDPVRGQAVSFGGSRSLGTWFLDLDDVPPVRMPLIEASATPGNVRVAWRATGGAAVATLERRAEGAATWGALGVVRTDGSGALGAVDPSAESGVRYAYRLVDVATASPLTDEAWVPVPWPAEVTLAGAVPNPVLGALTVRFALRGAEPATLELEDLAGRRVLARQVGSLGIGPHVVVLVPGGTLRPGTYFLRLTQGGHSRTAKAVVLR